MQNMTSVVGINISETSYIAATDRIKTWALADESRAVYATGVHGIIEAHDSPDFKIILDRADLITPDGMPLVWMMRLKGVKGQTRVYGPTLMLHVLEMAAREQLPVGFYGGEDLVLEKLANQMRGLYKGLKVAYAYSPPFRSLDQQETEKITNEIAQSEVRILFVGLGCPKQETWIDAHIGKINAVMLGVGAAFDFLAGSKPQAPAWMQAIGMEWFYRLLHEPRRLGRRYLRNNPRFVMLAITDLLGILGKGKGEG